VLKNKAVTLIGYSGHAFMVADAAMSSQMGLKFYTEQTEMIFNPYNLKYLGFESSKQYDFTTIDCDYILGIGDNSLRSQVGRLILSSKNQLLNVIHPKSDISSHVTLGNGIFISKNANVNTLANIGDFCILNTGCIIEHECKIGSSSHIAPGAVLLGNVEIGNNTLIGANAVVKQGVKIGANVIVGAGTVVLTDVPDNTKIVGNPARVI
tara:strand:- start:14073 stop:14699 length:627 start_codon:yes stop_codon:yes gene_type:complete